MAIKLRDYQIEAAKKLVKSISEGHRKILFCACTSFGKTILMLDFANRVADRGMKTLVVVNRHELLEQTIDKQEKGRYVGYLDANGFSPSNTLNVAMLQTLGSRLKQEKFQEWLETFDFIFFDEIHCFAGGNVFKTICDFKKDSATVIGVSATPTSNKNYLLEGFDDYVKGADTYDLLQLGYLVKPETYVSDIFDFSKVKISKTTNDYEVDGLDDVLIDTDKMDKILEGWLPYKNLKTVAFFQSVKSAEEYSNFFRLNGIKSEVLSGKTPTEERKRILADFRDGKIQILTNCNVLTAGFDEPSIECVILLNKTRTISKFIQSCGRGLRLCPEINKEKVIILDFCGNSFMHMPCDAIREYKFAPPKKDKEEEYTEIQCPICGTVFKIDEGVCPECGFVLELDEEGEGNVKKPKSKKDFEKLIKLKSVQQELHDIIFEFAGLNCLIKTEETNSVVNGRLVKKWCYGYRDDGTPIFKGDKDFSVEKYPYPLTTIAKKTNCWFVFHTICTSYNPSEGALRYYGKKLRKAKKFLEQIKNPDNRVFVNLYRLMD